MRVEQQLSIPLFILAVGSFIDCIVECSPWWHYFVYPGLFILIGILLLIFKLKISYKWYSLGLLGCSIIAFWVGELKSLTGVFILTFSFYIAARTKRVYCIYGAAAFLIIMTRFYTNTLGYQDLVMFLSGASFFVILYFHFIHPKPETLIAKSGYLAPHIKPLVVDIVHLQILGYKNAKINAILELSVANDRVRKIVTSEIKAKGFPNRESFIFYLTEKGVFKTMSDEITEGLSNHAKL